MRMQNKRIYSVSFIDKIVYRNLNEISFASEEILASFRIYQK